MAYLKMLAGTGANMPTPMMIPLEVLDVRSDHTAAALGRLPRRRLPERWCVAVALAQVNRSVSRAPSPGDPKLSFLPSMINTGVPSKTVRQIIAERRERSEEDGARQEARTGQQQGARHDGAVAEPDGDGPLWRRCDWRGQSR